MSEMSENAPVTLDGPCCALALCCPPKEQIAALVKKYEKHGLSEELAAELIADYVLIFAKLPETKAPMADSTLLACNKKLRTLHRHVKREQIDLLDTLGFQTAEE